MDFHFQMESPYVVSYGGKEGKMKMKNPAPVSRSGV